MKNHSIQVLQRSISKAFPGSRTQAAAEGFFLFLSGVLAMILHARLRIPMHLPGKQGILFMFIVMSASLLSRFRFSTLLTTTGAAALLLTGFGGFDDPFMPIPYLLLGFVLDMIFSSPSEIKTKSWFIGLAGGLGFSLVPLCRAIISLLTGLPYSSLFNGVVYPWLTHFLFGFAGSLLAALAVKTLSDKQ
jgi:hypothetical protein